MILWLIFDTKEKPKNKIEGQLGTITKETPNQKVTVQFTVNDTMPPLEEQDAIEAENREILW